MKFIIIGNGYIGNYLLSRLPEAILFAKKLQSKLEVVNLLDNWPDRILINAAGTTGRPNVDWCEDHKYETIQGNISLPIMIGEVCEERNRYWINLGSGCIYAGYDKEWTEDDQPNFVGSFYSLTKLFSENIIKKMHKSCTLRLRMPVDSDMGDRNLITKLLNYIKEDKPVMNDLKNSITFLDDLVEVIKFVSKNELTGVYNATNSGALSPTDVLNIYKELKDPKLEWQGIKYEDLLKNGYLKAERSNCLLSNKKLEEAGFKMPKIQNRLSKLLTEGDGDGE